MQNSRVRHPIAFAGAFLLATYEATLPSAAFVPVAADVVRFGGQPDTLGCRYFADEKTGDAIHFQDGRQVMVDTACNPNRTVFYTARSSRGSNVVQVTGDHRCNFIRVPGTNTIARDDGSCRPTNGHATSSRRPQIQGYNGKASATFGLN